MDAQRKKALAVYWRVMNGEDPDAEIKRLRAALESCLKNDKTKYQHHEPRPFDGLTPDAVGATIWKTPNEIAGSALFDPPKQTSPAVTRAASAPSAWSSWLCKASMKAGTAPTPSS